MKKNFKLTSTEKPVARHIELVKSEIKKYIARERRKELPEDSEFWEFDCKFGPSESEANVVFANELRGLVDDSVAKEMKSIYVEILSKPSEKKVKKDKKSEKTEKKK